MKTETSLKSLEQIARTRGLGTLLMGGLLVAFWMGGHGALYSAYRVASSHSQTSLVEAA